MNKEDRTENLKDLLAEVDMNGAQLARRLNISVAAVSAWSTGKSAPNYDKLPLIAQALGVPLDRVVRCFIS